MHLSSSLLVKTAVPQLHQGSSNRGNLPYQQFQRTKLSRTAKTLMPKGRCLEQWQTGACCNPTNQRWLQAIGTIGEQKMPSTATRKTFHIMHGDMVGGVHDSP